ncbi:replicative helicase loader/inhibitor [Alkalihalobacillus sp. CinArs1]|uniref:replicative helicase loader/inhibitor n=1 Tax=Alkalihalobacillus sp. CinArs1 TaxID=2995314 RepID=UPI0022DDB3C3|nr:replicative helicase loader/inhibitor [Alkalihalobacillus sp. CinArs1]
MNKKKAFQILNYISSEYPSFEVTQFKVDLWAKTLKKDNEALVMRNVESHLANLKYPPKLADIRASAPLEVDYLQLVDEWRKNAKPKG